MLAMIIPPRTSNEFDEELKALAERLVAMGARAEHQTVRAVRALVERDDRLADEVIAGDAAINQDEKEIDDQALQRRARTPGAALRRVYTNESWYPGSSTDSTADVARSGANASAMTASSEVAVAPIDFS